MKLKWFNKRCDAIHSLGRQLDIKYTSAPDCFRATSNKVKKSSTSTRNSRSSTSTRNSRSSASTRNSSRQVDINKPLLPDRSKAISYKLKKSVCIAVTVMVLLFSVFTVFGVEEDTGTEVTQSQEISTSEDIPTSEESEPITDEPQTEETQATSESEETTEPSESTSSEETESTSQEETTRPAFTQNTDLPPTETYDFEVPTMAKTVSTKTYSTNYTAGIISWFCVIVGMLAVTVVIVSTKGQRRA